ncbi:MAG: glycosyltransferase family 9 protein [Deltaproteobacteria bacterium]|nr:glycosyltransferase family 9 protein [Deltaproteobacteria bacterium]
MKLILKYAYLNIRKGFLKAASVLFHAVHLVHDIRRDDIRSILFIRIDRVGDLVLSTPILKAVKKAYPHSKLTVLASPGNCSLLMNNPYVDAVIVYDRKAGLVAKIRVIRTLRKSEFDLAIDPYVGYELETALIAFLSRARWRIGFAEYGREVFFNLRAPAIGEKRHFIDLGFDVAVTVGIEGGERTPEIFIDENEKKWAKAWLREHGVDRYPVAGIHPGGYYKTQRWLPENFADVVRLLHGKYGVKPIIFKGPGEEALVADICSRVDGKAVIFDAVDLRQFAAVLSCCNLLICNNSGPLHMAVALGVPTISFMGPTIKERWMPRGEIHAILRIDDLPCIGCNTGYCRIKTHDCMRFITPDMVMDCVNMTF